MSRARVRAYRRGLFAETLAAALFRLKGYRVVARRYKTPVGEIDLVALKGKRLAFIEVKARKSREAAAWTLPTRQRRRIVGDAQYWLSSHPTLPDTRWPSTWCSLHLGVCRITSPTHFRFDEGLNALRPGRR